MVHAGVGVEGVEDVEGFEEAFDVFFGVGFVLGDVVAPDAGVGDGDVELVADVPDIA